MEWPLQILGYADPDDNHPVVSSTRPSQRSISYVRERLKTLPEVHRQLEDLQASQQKIRATESVDKALQAFCRCAGDALLRAFERVESVRNGLESTRLETYASNAFSSYEGFRDALLEIREAHAVWEVSMGDEAFPKRQSRPRAVRFEYLWFMLKLVYTLSEVIFPEEYHATYLEGLETLLGRQDWKDQLMLDSEATYEQSKKRAIPGIIAPPERYPRRYLNHGQTELRPRLLHNQSAYGHRLVPNVRSLRQSEGTLMRREVTSTVYLVYCIF